MVLLVRPAESADGVSPRSTEARLGQSLRTGCRSTMILSRPKMKIGGSQIVKSSRIPLGCLPNPLAEFLTSLPMLPDDGTEPLRCVELRENPLLAGHCSDSTDGGFSGPVSDGHFEECHRTSGTQAGR